MKMRLRRKDGNRSSIKEAVDTLPAGVCYFTESGMVKLCNKQMFRLFRSLAQADLQTLEELRTALGECDGRTGVLHLPGPRPVYLFPDGKAWAYTESSVTAKDGNTYTEAMFSNVTELYEKKRELELQIRKLKQMSRKMKELSENAAEAAREREILTAKTKIHAQMSENLTMLRQTLTAGSSRSAQDAAVEAMGRTVRFLMEDAEAAGRDPGLDEFLQTASNCGVTVTLEGELPSRPDVHQVFVIAMREFLTNCVRHGEADALHIALREEDGSAICAISNNGSLPEGEITPQGGLKNLYRHVENCGGRMDIRCRPAFTLTITIPAGKEEKP